MPFLSVGAHRNMGVATVTAADGRTGRAISPARAWWGLPRDSTGMSRIDLGRVLALGMDRRAEAERGGTGECGNEGFHDCLRFVQWTDCPTATTFPSGGDARDAEGTA